MSIGRYVAQQQGSGGEEADPGSDDAGEFCGGGSAAAPLASPASGPAARRLHGRRTDLHHHGAAAERITQ